MSELQLHRSVAEFLDWVVMPPAVWTTIPAGWTAMSKGQAGRLKACGLKAGMPDIMIFYNSFAIGIELKAGGHKATAIQVGMHAKLQAAGVPVAIARSVDDVERVLRLYRIPMRKISYAPRHTAPESRSPQEPAQGETPAAP